MARRIALFCFMLLAVGVSAAAETDRASQVKAIGLQEALVSLPDSIKTPNRYALVIGVGQYNDSRIPELAACTNDARQLYKVLIDPSVGMFRSGNATLLLDENVTRNKVVAALDMLGRKAGKEDLVVVFFSGHGAIDEKGRSYWVMQDSRIDSLRATALAETEITELLGEIRTTRLVTLIDACYSASTAKLGKSKSLLDLKRIYPKFTGDGRVMITASKGDQLSVVISDKNHPGKGYSAFTWHLIRAMKGLGDADKDGVVTVNELWDYVKDRTETTARQQGGNQQPRLKGQIGSKFLLTVDSQRLVTNSQRTRQSLETLKKLFMNDKIDSDIYKEGKKLLTSVKEPLNDAQQQRRQVYIDLVSGELKPKYLQSVLDAIEMPEQRAARAEQLTLWTCPMHTEFRLSKPGPCPKCGMPLSLERKTHKQTEQIKQPKEAEVISPGDIITNSIGMKLVYIPAGEFKMGSPLSESQRGSDEGPQHPVKISQGFWMGIHEVTQSQYKAVMGTSPWSGETYARSNSSNAASYISWNDAMEFCKKLGQKDGRTYTLPTEAQWEYACRAGGSTRFSFGDRDSNISVYAWYRGNAWDKGEKYAHPAGQKKANAFGLYDMHGNVWEWCRDYYAKDFYGKAGNMDPENIQSSSYRVLRGGGWSNSAAYCRSAIRYWLTPGDRYGRNGFRVVLSVSSLDF